MDAAATTQLLYERTGDTVVVRRPGQPDADLRAFVTSVDVNLLDDRFTSASQRITFPTASGRLDAGDRIEHAGAIYRVLQESRRIRDGHESDAPLTELI